MDDPIPFEIASLDGVRTASNGAVRVSIFEDEEASMCKMRAISGIAPRPAAEVVIPLLNQLAGELLKKVDTPAEEVRNQLLAISGLVPVQQLKKHEWLKVTIGEWKVYTDGVQIVVTKKNLNP